MERRRFNSWCRSGNIEKIKETVEAGFDMNYLFDDWTPLMLSVFYMQAEICDYLISKGANVNAVDFNGDPVICCPLFYTDFENNWESFQPIMAKLIDSGAKLDIINQDHVNILVLCARARYYETFAFLLKKGADINHIFTHWKEFDKCENELHLIIDQYAANLAPENKTIWKSFRLKTLFM